MKQNNRGQLGRILLYVIMLVIFVIILSFGYTSIKGLDKQKQGGISLDFENKITEISKSMKNEFGGYAEKEINIGEDVRKICIVDFKYHRDDILNNYDEIISEFPIIKQNLEMNISDNVYYYSDTGFLRSTTANGICVPKDPYFYCAINKNKTVKLGFEGKGECSALTMVFPEAFTVNVNNIRNSSKYGNRTLVIYPKGGNLGGYSINLLRVLTAFIYKTQVNSVINPVVFFDNQALALSPLEVFNLKNKYKGVNMTYYENKPDTIDDSLAYELEIENIYDYLSFWQNYYDVVLVSKGESDQDYLTSAIFASNINAPLLVYNNTFAYGSILGLKNIYLINKESFSLAEYTHIMETYSNITLLDSESLRLGLYFAEQTGMFQNPIRYLTSKINN